MTKKTPYDTIASWFDKHRSREFFEKPVLDTALALLCPGATVLDIGCGMGEPIMGYLIEQGFNVTGIDSSEELLNLAKERFPQASFILQDMRALSLSKTFNCIIAWHSLFHLSREDQKNMFSVFAQHLNSGGILLFTSGEEDGEIWSNNGGIELYHASLSQKAYEELLAVNHFEKIFLPEDLRTCNGNAFAWFARYRG